MSNATISEQMEVDLIAIMQGQARVWYGTPYADVVLEDTARAIGHMFFRFTGEELNAFAARCMSRFD